MNNERVTGLNNGDDVSGLYEKVSNGTSAVIKNTLYKRKKDTYPYEYEEYTGTLEYGIELKDYYEKSSNKETAAKAYYIRSGKEPPYTYTPVSGLEYGSKLDGYYEYTDDFCPPAGYSRNAYWHNTFDNMTYHYTSDDGQGGSGFAICAVPSFPNLKYAAVHL